MALLKSSRGPDNGCQPSEASTYFANVDPPVSRNKISSFQRKCGFRISDL